MAIFHFTGAILSRSRGQSAVAKAAYNARAEIENEQTGQVHDYTRAQGLAFSGIFAPANAPDWAQDRGKLWSEVEAAEKRKDAQLARSFEIGLPHELTDEQRQQLITDFVRENFVRKGMIADVTIHLPHNDGDDRNHHTHILLTTRQIGAEGFGQKAREWNSKEQLETWRENWARTANRYLERHGHEARIDHRSLEAQGIDREPTQHLGPQASQMERAGEPSERGDINRDIEARNRERERLQLEARAVSLELTEAATPEQNREAINAAFKKAHIATDRADDFIIMLQRREVTLSCEGGQLLAKDKDGNIFPAEAKDFDGLFPDKVFWKLHKHFEEKQNRPQDIDSTKAEGLTHREKSDTRKVASLYDRADMVSQQADAMRHVKDHEKQARKLDDINRREAEAIKRLEAKEKQQRGAEREKRQHRETQDRPQSQSTAPERKDQAQERREERAARTEQSEAVKRHTQKEIMRELFERKFGKGTNEKDMDLDRGRERER